MIPGELRYPSSSGASRAMDAVARFEMRFASYRNQGESIASLCDALAGAGYPRAAVGHRVDGDPLRILPIMETPVRESPRVIVLSGGTAEMYSAVDGRNAYVTETTIARPGDTDFGAAETVIAVGFAWYGEAEGVLVVSSNEPGAFDSQERTAVECVAAHLSVALEIVGQRLAIENGEDNYRQLVESINEIIYTATLDGRITYVNSAIERVLGVPAAAFLERGFEQFVPMENRAAIWDGFTRQRCGAGPAVELRGQRRSGAAESSSCVALPRADRRG